MRNLDALIRSEHLNESCGVFIRLRVTASIAPAMRPANSIIAAQASVPGHRARKDYINQSHSPSAITATGVRQRSCETPLGTLAPLTCTFHLIEAK
jgi:hypothetical protein